MRRILLGSVAVVLAVAGVVWIAVPGIARVRTPIKVGLLHSLTGPMAVNERSMVDAEVLALKEIAGQGGLLGRPIEWVIADGRSDAATFAKEAERLIREEKVCAIFGCYTSASRKAVKDVVEKAGSLLIYSVAYEGLGGSPNLVYVGAAPNQQIIPTVKWCSDQLKAKTFYLIGNDFVWPRTVNTIIKDQLKALGATLAGEDYIDFGSTDLDAAAARAVAAKPDVILSTLVGDSNPPFYKKIRGGSLDASKIPIVSFIIAEDEVKDLTARELVNDYAVCNYFQAIDRIENRDFVRRYKAVYGQDKVTSDTIDTAYNAVKLWAQAVTDAETDETRYVLTTIGGQSLNAAEGVITIDRETLHAWRPFYIGKVRPDGQFDLVWSVPKPIRPVPFPFSRSRQEWERYLENLRQGWGGQWIAPPKPK